MNNTNKNGSIVMKWDKFVEDIRITIQVEKKRDDKFKIDENA